MWLLLLPMVLASYLPGTNPKNYKSLDQISMFVGKLESSITQLPFDYYYLNFCKPNKAISISENLGVSLSGNLVESTPYRIYMQIRENCNRLCKTTNSKSDIKALEWIIENKYKAT